MIGPTTPLAERPDWHPVHRANALLEAAMLNSAQAEPYEGRHTNVESLSQTIASVLNGPVSISYPTSLSARLDAAFDLLDCRSGHGFRTVDNQIDRQPSYV